MTGTDVKKYIKFVERRAEMIGEREKSEQEQKLHLLKTIFETEPMRGQSGRKRSPCYRPRSEGEDTECAETSPPGEGDCARSFCIVCCFQLARGKDGYRAASAGA